MIWFACKKCALSLGRPDEQAGSLVFCTCGQANRVPWESSSAEPVSDGERHPIPIISEDENAPAKAWGKWTETRSNPSRGRSVQRRDPGYCLNHPETASEHTCEDCQEAFCAGCLVTLQHRTLCGPCKNRRIGLMHRPTYMSGTAVGSLAVGLIGVVPALWIPLAAVGLHQNHGSGFVLTTLFGMILPVLALFLGGQALRSQSKDRRLGGRGVAMIGLIAGATSTLWCLTVIGLSFIQLVGN